MAELADGNEPQPASAALPMAPSCSLDESGLRRQLERYRQAGEHARLTERTRRSLIVEFAPSIDTALVSDAICVERECCPFFSLDWSPEQRRLVVSVSQEEHEPALDAIAQALAV